MSAKSAQADQALDAALADRFIALLGAQKTILYKVVSAYCHDREDRADLTQDILVELWLAFPDYDARAKFSTWMYRVAMNVAISHLRHRTRKQRDSRQTISLEDFGIDLLAADEADATQSDNMRTLFALIRELDEVNRSLMLLFLDGYSADEIAAIIGITPSNVSTRINRLKQRLTDAFANL